MKLLDLPGLSNKRLDALVKNNIQRPADLLHLFPRRYLDRTTVLPIRSLHGSGEEVTVVGRVKNIQLQGYGKKKRLEVLIQDNTASLKGVWFKGVNYFKNLFKKDEVVAFFGKAKRYGRYITIAHPDFNKIEDHGDLNEMTRIVPIYPSNKDFSKARITNNLMQQWMAHIYKEIKPEEFLPNQLRNELNMPERAEAYRMIHFPESTDEYRKAFWRFKFEEFLLFELSVAKIKHTIHDRASGHLFSDLGNYTSRFFNEELPFELTEGQKNALSDIKRDVRSGHQMNRLIQGDVGSGKTVVAIGAILMALDNNYQATFMAPTEILAEQHYRTLTNFLEPLDINTRLLIGSQSNKLREDIYTDIASGRCQITVGTHAIIQEKVDFHRLGLAVIDEQHRFGVKQRSEILNKGDRPHILVMSATPIPRSLAMTLYSDLDISVIKGLPGGRKPVKTALRTESKREQVYEFMDENLQEGGQAYVVYPLVEESEKMDLKDATRGFEQLKKRFPGYEVGLLHGRMNTEDKDAIMRQFIDNEIQILVSTTVIEVGVDVANANIMLIEHAERFGLSQLHQLRGRIGRGSRQSYCILLPDSKVSKEGKFRLEKMVETNDGFEIAEADLKLRGPGDFLGTKQSGLPDFKVADIIEDQHILKVAKDKAWEIMEEDPEMEKAEHQALKEEFMPYFKERARFYGMV